MIRKKIQFHRPSERQYLKYCDIKWFLIHRLQRRRVWLSYLFMRISNQRLTAGIMFRPQVYHLHRTLLGAYLEAGVKTRNGPNPKFRIESESVRIAAL